MSEQVDVLTIPQFPVSLRGKKGRYRVEVQIGRETYSATSDMPESAGKGAAVAAYILGGYELDMPEFPAPKHPLIVDMKMIWAVISGIGKLVAKKVKSAWRNQA